MGEPIVPVLKVMENTRDGVSRRVPIRRSKSFDASFLQCHAMQKPKPSIMELEKSQWIIYHPESPPINGYCLPNVSSNHPPTISDIYVQSRLAYLKRNCKDKGYMMWDNWDAALISLKKEEARKEENTSYRYRKEIRFARDVVKKECCCAVCSSSSSSPSSWRWSGEKECERLVMVGKAVTALTLHAMSFVNLDVFEDRLSAETFDEVRLSLFQNVARVVLSIFDIEDFEAIYHRNHLKDQYRLFTENFSLQDSDKYNRDLFCECDKLREPDVCDIIRQCEVFKEERFNVSPWFFFDEKDLATDIHESDFNNAMSLINQHHPMRESFKVQLTLELMREKSFHVFDNFVAHTLYCIPLCDLFEYVGYQKKLILRNKRKKGAEEAFKGFVEGVVNGLHDLASMKSSALIYYQEAIIFPISFSGLFGPCTEEVVQVMKLADLHRRKQDHKFIGLQDVLFGLSLSRLGYCSKILKGHALECPHELVSILNFYEIVRSLSPSSSYMVTLEDLIDAILFLGKDPTNREILKRQIFEDSSKVAAEWEESRSALCWEDSDVFSEVGLEWTAEGAKLSYARGEDFIKALQVYRDNPDKSPLFFGGFVY